MIAYFQHDWLTFFKQSVFNPDSSLFIVFSCTCYGLLIFNGCHHGNNQNQIMWQKTDKVFHILELYTKSRMGVEECCKKRLQGYLYSCNKTNNIKRVIISLPISSPQEQFESLWHPKSHKSTRLLLDSYVLLHEFSRYVLLVHMIPEREKQVIEENIEMQ